jgi:hypothetical protein
MTTRLDHIVIAAANLQEGADYVNKKLGIEIPAGGRHEMMGTHNRVMSLGSNIYLEVIAIHPDMKVPGYPRWFGLDDPHVRESLKGGPRLLTWAVNCDDLDHVVENSGVPLGEVKEAKRDDLEWRVAISEDGRLPGAGFIPLCIQWMVDFHPSQRMLHSDWNFVSLELYYSRKLWLEQALDSIGAIDLVSIHEIEDGERPELRLLLNGPAGEVVFSSAG